VPAEELLTNPAPPDALYDVPAVVEEDNVIFPVPPILSSAPGPCVEL
jgi:hypothetical protein